MNSSRHTDNSDGTVFKNPRLSLNYEGNEDEDQSLSAKSSLQDRETLGQALISAGTSKQSAFHLDVLPMSVQSTSNLPNHPNYILQKLSSIEEEPL
jgi:hypothetical protein